MNYFKGKDILINAKYAHTVSPFYISTKLLITQRETIKIFFSSQVGNSIFKYFSYIYKIFCRHFPNYVIIWKPALYNCQKTVACSSIANVSMLLCCCIHMQNFVFTSCLSWKLRYQYAHFLFKDRRILLFHVT